MPSSYWDEALVAKYRAFQYHFPERPLQGRVFILAGGAGGLGAATTTLLASARARIERNPTTSFAPSRTHWAPW